MLFMASLYSTYESFCRDEASAMENKQQKPQSYIYKIKFADMQPWLFNFK